MESQITSNILMIRPVRFGFNAETADSNAFQNTQTQLLSSQNTQSVALKEFDEMVASLRESGVNVLVFDDTEMPFTPDSIFPNNWISFHPNALVCLYPMQAPNRRLERRNDIIDILSESFVVERVEDLTHFENSDKFLEGTGSIVLDRKNKIAYACLSPRTNEEVLKAWNEIFPDYSVQKFKALDASGKEIYHTNVLMCVGDGFAVICLDAIADLDERLRVQKSLEESGHAIISISFEQMNQFAGNMLLVKNVNEDKILVMSSSAYHSLEEYQLEKLATFAQLKHFNLEMIENCGGGSARCMLAEIHLKSR